jgi:hypothetical protein
MISGLWQNIVQRSRLINALSLYMIEDLWCTWKAYLPPQRVPVPQFENLCFMYFI